MSISVDEHSGQANRGSHSHRTEAGLEYSQQGEPSQDKGDQPTDTAQISYDGSIIFAQSSDELANSQQESGSVESTNNTWVQPEGTPWDQAAPQGPYVTQSGMPNILAEGTQSDFSLELPEPYPAGLLSDVPQGLHQGGLDYQPAAGQQQAEFGLELSKCHLLPRLYP
ncbi:uncharacterized protein K444DRAFT_271428 [Hyaloscypha bicolor E]|uniref:Uncharacterized protein n=1 Tax=Hyaloscypha bicolor E TaxID=1095630 RepID=A0A2J6SIE2_9HELO|nr:uncharacterized protein K444DRAFT_271428 [Hyaloscypha bicolor E]PMD50542.1 hypothetical protein K444DRAFT_271428 [Hyaloscypha bicolor E]